MGRLVADAAPGGPSLDALQSPAMGSLFKVLGATLLTGLLLGGAHLVMAPTLPEIAGMPVVCVPGADGPSNPEAVLGLAPCWFAFGGGKALVVVGLAGAGLVCITLYGVGILFATGQLALGGLAIGQAGAGIIGWIGQVGAGLTGVGQLIFGVYVQGQLPIGANGGAFHAALSRQLQSTLRRAGEPYDLDPALPSE